MADAPPVPDELAAARARAIADEAVALGAPRQALRLEDVKPMLAETAPQPFSRAGWLYEIKYDGFRLLLGRHAGQVRLGYRSGADSTALFPDVVAALAQLPGDDLVLDGEVVVHDDDGKPSFNRLQNRTQLLRPQDIERAAANLPATVHVFDLLALQGVDLRPLPLVVRKRLLSRLLAPVTSGVIRYADHVEARGIELFQEVARLGLEGLMAKDGRSPYRPGRSGDWLKLRVELTDDFIVVGWTAPRRSRSGFGALHLAQLHEGRLFYAGRVGSGFDEKLLVALGAELRAHKSPRHTMAGAAPDTAATHWTTPRLVCEVKYQDWPADGVLRFPVFLRLRTDKAPGECHRRPAPGAGGSLAADVVALAPSAALAAPEDEARPAAAPGHDASDVLAYYGAVAFALLPYLRNRRLELVGRDGKRLRGVELAGDDVAALLRAIAGGAHALHVAASRTATRQLPDWCVVALDAVHGSFADAVAVALALRALCDELGLPVYVKTAGATGLHLLVPLGRRHDYAQAQQLAALLAHLVADAHPELCTTESAVARREGRVAVDASLNRAGSLLLAPFSLCAGTTAAISVPLEWAELHADLTPASFTWQSVPARLAQLGRDPMGGVLTDEADLNEALVRLARRVR